MRYLKAVQSSLMIIVLAVLGLSVAIRWLVAMLPVLVIILVILLIGGLLIGRRSVF